MRILSYIETENDSRARAIDEARAAFDACPDREELEAEAARRGFRRPDRLEHLALGWEELFTWRGWQWVRVGAEEQ